MSPFRREITRLCPGLLRRSGRWPWRCRGCRRRVRALATPWPTPSSAPTSAVPRTHLEPACGARRARSRPCRSWGGRAMRRVQRAFQTRALVLLVVIASLLTSSCAPGPTLHRAAGVQLAFAWQWVAPSPSYVGMPAADDTAVAATFGHHGVILLTPTGAVRWQVEHDRLRDVAPALGTDIVVAAAEGGVVAFDRATGAERWVASLG